MDRHEDPAPTRGQPRLLDQVRYVIRRLHYSIRTEQTYSIGSDGSSCSTGSSAAPPALNILATREDPDGLHCMAARLQFPVRPQA